MGALSTVTKGLVKGRTELGNKRTSGNNPTYSTVEIGQNTEKSPGDLRKLFVTQNPVKDRQLTLIWKKSQEVIIIIIVIGALGTITKGLLKGLEDMEIGGRVETIQTTALLRTARIFGRVLETWGDLLSLKLQWKTIS